MIEACVRIIGILCYSEEIAWKLIDEYDLIVFLECGGNGRGNSKALTPSLWTPNTDPQTTYRLVHGLTLWTL